MTEAPNLNYIKQLSGGDKDFEKQLIEVIKDEFPLEKKEYYNNLKNNEIEIILHPLIMTSNLTWIKELPFTILLQNQKASHHM